MKTKNNSSELKNRIAQQDKNTTAEAKPQWPKLDCNRRNQNRALPMEALLKLIQQEAPDFWNVVEIVGKWVWVQFDGKQPREITFVLAQLGFHWNYRRGVWQHPCGMVTERAEFDPRKKYRAYFAAQSQTV
jgi:hypothetical protein